VLLDEQPSCQSSAGEERIFVMAVIEVFRTLQNQAEELCAECLSGDIADNAAFLGDMIELAETMAAIRHLSRDNEELYQRALDELMASVMIIAVFSSELSKRPVLFEAKASLN
jgi:hypothetical protein